MPITLSVAISNKKYELFMRLKKLKGFRNQPETLEWLIEQISKQEGLT